MAKLKPPPIKRTRDGIALLNLACGAKTNDQWNNLDFSPYARLRQTMWIAKLLRWIGVLSDTRWERLKSIDPSIRYWDLRRGIPFPDNTFDVVYHSHFLEHLPKESVPAFLEECLRVCLPGGIIRVVVPDLEHMVRSYHTALERLDESDPSAWHDYDAAIHNLFDQMVRRGSTGARDQKKWVSVIEEVVRGAADRTGELHQWAYDRHSLSRVLSSAGFTNIGVKTFSESSAKSWNSYGLDQLSDGTEHKLGSCYVEGKKPK